MTAQATPTPERKTERKTEQKADRRAQRKASRAEKLANRPESRGPSQLRALLKAVHPRQALVLAVAVGTLVALTGRPGREIAISAATVLVAQLIMGLLNDVCDIDRDRMGGAKDKPIADGVIPPGNATFAIAVLLLLVIPLSLQNGTEAGLYALATLLVGLVHNRWLHTTALSWVGWAATFALLTFFVTYGGWGRDADGSAPLTTFVILCAVLGVCVHFLTSLPDLVVDNQAGTRNLPLRVALRTGAPRLMIVAIVVTVVVVAAIVVTTAQAGAIAS